MANIDQNNQHQRNTPKGLKKLSTRVDLTPMVDLGFLLITFFVFTTTMATPTVMQLGVPKDVKEPDNTVCHSAVLTLMLERNNKILYYEGNNPNPATDIKTTDYSPSGIRSILVSKKKKVQNGIWPCNEPVVIIQSDKESSFKNFVNIMDEMLINRIDHYFIMDMTDTDRQLVAAATQP